MIPKDVLFPLINKSGLIFSFSVELITPLFSIDDMPQGYNTWSLRGKVLKIYKGSLASTPGTKFETRITIYDGPIRSRPVGLWINVIPKENEDWVVFCSLTAARLKPEELLEGLGKTCWAVCRLDHIKNALNQINAKQDAPIDTSADKNRKCEPQ